MLSIFRGQRPDVTPAQAVALVVAGVPVVSNLLRAFGVYDPSPEQEKALGDAIQWGGITAVGLFAADAGVRAARNSADAKTYAAAVTSPTQPPDVVHDMPQPYEAETVSDNELPSDEEEFAAPPPDELEDEPTDPAVVQPSQRKQ